VIPGLWHRMEQPFHLVFFLADRGTNRNRTRACPESVFCGSQANTVVLAYMVHPKATLDKSNVGDTKLAVPTNICLLPLALLESTRQQTVLA